MEEDEVVSRTRKKKWTHEPHLNGVKFPDSKYYGGTAKNRNTEWALTAGEKEKQLVPFDMFTYFKPLLAADTDYDAITVLWISAYGKPRRGSLTSNQAFRIAIVIDNPDSDSDDPKLIGPMSDMFSVNPRVTRRVTTPPEISSVKWVISLSKRQKIL